MLENLPLHPAVVHLPIGIMIVLPIVSVFMMALYFRGAFSKQALLVIVLLHAVLMGTSYLALETGEDEEHVAEKVVSESVIENHEEKAEVFMIGTVIVFFLSMGLAVPFSVPLKPVLGSLLLGQLVLLGLGYQVGHSGGELVYVHGAAQAYLTEAGGGQGVEKKHDSHVKEKGEDDDD